MVAGVGVLASAHGSEVSPVLRPAARALGISVDSPELQEAKSEMASLRSALDRGDEAGIARGVNKLVDAMRALDDGDRSAIRDDALRLLTRADEELRRLAALRVHVEPVSDVGTGTNAADGSTSSPERAPASTSGSAADVAGSGVATSPAGPAAPAIPGTPAVTPPAAGSGDESDDWSSPGEEHEDEPPEPPEPAEGADD